ncbi:MAG: hypothetical protein WBA46_09665 [Thermomicrobiales bacterium]
MADDPSPAASPDDPRGERRDQRMAAQHERMAVDRVEKLALILSLAIGLASVLAWWAGRERPPLLAVPLVVPLVIVAAVGAIVLTNPRFPRRRWLAILALPIVFWAMGVLMTP